MINNTLILKKTNYKEQIDIFFKENYNELIDICKKSCKNTDFDYNDLYAELYLYLIDNKEKIQNLIKIEGKEDKPLMRFCAQWAYNNLRLYTPNKKASNFKAKYQLKEENKIIIGTPDSNHTIFFLKEKIETNQESIENIEIKNIKEEKLLNIEKIYENMDEIDKKIYDSYFSENLNFIQIANKYNISVYSAKKLVTDMLSNFKNINNQL